MTVSFVNYAASGVVAAPSAQGPQLTSVAGNLLVVVVRIELTTATDRTATISDLAGNSYSLATKTVISFGANYNIMFVWYAWNVPAYTNNRQTITLNENTPIGVVQAQFSGVRTSSDPFVGVQSVTGASTAEVTTPAISFTGGGALVVVGTSWPYASTWTPGTGVTEHVDNAADKLIMLGSKTASAGNNSATATVSNVTKPWGLISVGFADDSAAAGGFPVTRSRFNHLLIR